MVNQRTRLGTASPVDWGGSSAGVRVSRVKPLPPFGVQIAPHTWYGVQPSSTRRAGYPLECMGTWEIRWRLGKERFDKDSAETLGDCIRGG